MKIFSTKRLPGKIYQTLEDLKCEIKFWEKDSEISSAELIEHCENVDILILGGFNILDKEVLEQLTSVKLICLYSVGFNHVDIEAANALGKKVTHTPDVLSEATADTAFLLMLATSRKAFYLADTVRKGTWGAFNPTGHLGQELHGKTLGIIGLGKIGYYMAKRSQDAYNMEVIYHNRNQRKDFEEELGVKYVSLEELFKAADVISIHTDLNADSKHILDKAAFEKMKGNVIIVNTARGDVIQQEDLVEALKTGKIWGAGLDVTTPEPLPADHPLLDFPQVCILPHVGSATIETREAMSDLVLNNILAFMKGEELLTEVK